MTDYVYPNNNEKAFIQMAEYFGIEKLCFIYQKEPDIRKVRLLQESTKVVLSAGIEFRGSPRKTKASVVFVRANEDIRKYLQNLKVKGVIGVEQSPKLDYMHHRNSGLNQVLCKVAKDCKTSVVYSFSDLLNVERKKRAIFLGRMRQNMKFCRKYKTPVIIGSFAKHPTEMRCLKDIELLF